MQEFAKRNCTLFLSARRKNERIGDQIVFTGYKNFVALLVTTLIPLAFSSALYNNDYVAKLISFVILGSITFYVTIAIFEKSFKIDKSAFKLLAAFMIFILTTGIHEEFMLIRTLLATDLPINRLSQRSQRMHREHRELRVALSTSSIYDYATDSARIIK